MQLIHIPLYKPAVIPLNMVDFKSAIKVIPTPVLVLTDFTRHSPPLAAGPNPPGKYLLHKNSSIYP